MVRTPFARRIDLHRGVSVKLTPLHHQRTGRLGLYAPYKRKASAQVTDICGISRTSRDVSPRKLRNSRFLTVEKAVPSLERAFIGRWPSLLMRVTKSMA